jgi:hypothetical protein
MRPPIGEALASDALQGFYSPVLIVNAKRNAVRIAEVELGKVAVQVLFLAVLIDTLRRPQIKAWSAAQEQAALTKVGLASS